LKGEEDELKAIQIVQDALSDEGITSEVAERMAKLLQIKADIRDKKETARRFEAFIKMQLESGELSQTQFDKIMQ
jgi:hypothetical protein